MSLKCTVSITYWSDPPTTFFTSLLGSLIIIARKIYVTVNHFEIVLNSVWHFILFVFMWYMFSISTNIWFSAAAAVILPLKLLLTPCSPLPIVVFRLSQWFTVDGDSESWRWRQHYIQNFGNTAHIQNQHQYESPYKHSAITILRLANPLPSLSLSHTRTRLKMLTSAFLAV
jgi:hypothetical protein